MKKDDAVYISHILESTNAVVEYTKGKIKSDFLHDPQLQDAIIRRCEIIGEAVKQLSPVYKKKYPSIPWKKIAGMRDLLIHQYFGVDLDSVWNTAQKDIPELKKTIKKR